METHLGNRNLLEHPERYSSFCNILELTESKNGMYRLNRHNIVLFQSMSRFERQRGLETCDLRR